METNGTPRARPPLKFANRVYEFKASTPQGSATTRRLGTPQTLGAGASARKLFPRDDLPASSLSSGSISAARNIFRASAITDTPKTQPFSPQIPPSTMKRVFAPGVQTPDSKRLFRDSVARPTPRGMAAKATGSTDLFKMRIPSPPPELTGESMMNEIPDTMKAKGTVYADQYLSHLCPPEFDDLQRRQFFCILDLRRLKFSANEIFAKKDWKLNIMNFAKEFEKSRSLIMLRYGLYEFKNVRPSDEVMKKWRAAHNLPEPVEDAPVDSPSRVNGTKTSTKRKAEEELIPKDAPLSASSANKNKRRAVGRDDEVTSTPGIGAHKRKASVSEAPDENHPAKVPKSTPSATKSLLEKIASNSTTPAPVKPAAKPAQFGSTLQPTLFAPTPRHATNGGAVGSVLDGIKPGTPQPQYGQDNLFGHLSDVSAHNSGIDADGESSPDSDDEAETQEANQSSDPSVVASGRADTPSSLPGGALFANKKPQSSSALAAPPSNTSRESTPGRSIFERLTKGTDGEPVRLSGSTSEVAAPEAPPASEPPKLARTNNTWTPDTPIKFGSSTTSVPAGALFGASTTSSSIFGKAPTSTSSIFAPKPEKSVATPVPAAAPARPAVDVDKSGGESDKENTTKPTSQPLFGSIAKPVETTTQPPSLFQTKPAAAPSSGKPLFGVSNAASETTNLAPTKPAFGAAASAPSLFQAKPSVEKEPETVSKPPPAFGSTTKLEAPQTSGLFGSQTKVAPTGAASAPSPFQSSTLFGAPKPAESAPIATSAEGAKSAPSIFGTQSTSNADGLFGVTLGASSSIFGAAAAPKESPAPAKPAGAAAAPIFSFGATQSAAPAQPKEPAKPAAAPPIFSFGASQAGATKPIFGAAPSTPAAPSAKRVFDGSPMKQDDPSPAKKLFGAPSASSSAPLFSFGGSTAASNPFSTSTSAPAPAPAAISFGGGSGGGGSSFTFTAGSEQVRNPFASANSGSAPAAPASTTGGMFNFSAGGASGPAAGNGGATPFVFGSSAGPAGGAGAGNTSNPFLFGAASSAKPEATSTNGIKASPFQFGANGSATQPAPMAQSQKPLFGGATSAPTFNFTAASPQPQANGASPSIFAPKPNPPAPSLFGSALQPGGGASTTGTNSPFNFGGASSLATTPATGTPEPVAEREPPAAASTAGGDAEDGEAEPPQEQIRLTEGGPGEEDEEVVHEVRAKVLKFTPPGQGSDSDEKASKNKSPWSTKGVGPFRILKHKATGGVRILLRAEPRGHVALNRSLLPDMKYKAEEKYVKLTTSNDDGTGLETWMVQVKSKDLAVALATALEEAKVANRK